MTLIDQIIKNLTLVKIKKPNQKYNQDPKLKQESEIKQATNFARAHPGIVQILSRLQKSPTTKEALKNIDEKIDNDTIKVIKNNFDAPLGGYGTAGKEYGHSSSSSYVDYDKLFSYLGKFRAGSSVEFSESPLLAQSAEVGFNLADSSSINTGARFVKYFLNQGTAMQSLALSNVPVAGMTAEEWSSFKLWMQLDPVMYRLKTTTS